MTLLLCALRRVVLGAIALLAIAVATSVAAAAGLLAASPGAPSLPLIAAALAAAAGGVLPSLAVFRAYRRSGIGVALAIDETAVGLVDLLPPVALVAGFGWLAVAAAGPDGRGLIIASVGGCAGGLALLPPLLAGRAAGRESTAGRDWPSCPWRASARSGATIGGALLAVAALGVLIAGRDAVAGAVAGLSSLGVLAMVLVLALLPIARGGMRGLGSPLLLIAASSLTALAVARLTEEGGGAAAMDARVLPALVAVAAADAMTLWRRRRAILASSPAVVAAPMGALFGRWIGFAGWLLAALAGAPTASGAIARALAAAFLISILVLTVAVAVSRRR